jgi:hypothetical protein
MPEENRAEIKPNEVKPRARRSFLWIWFLAPLVLGALAYLGWYLYIHLNRPGKETPLDVLATPAFSPLPLGSVMPKGWLLDQLKLQSSGLTGHLDEFWPDVKDSGWIGGKAEGWERAPYWLDGLVPMAFLTDDAKLKTKAKRWVDYILKHQTADGWLGPEQGNPPYGLDAPPNEIRDPWPEFVILKVLSQYEEATNDLRIIPAMERSMRSIDVQMDKRPLFNWNFFRWGDLVVSIYWMYDRTHEPWLMDFAVKAANQGYNWTSHFWDLPLKHKSERWNWVGHGVNNAMGLKVPALLYRLTGDDRYKKLAWRAIEQLDRYHGEPNGLMSADECLAGLNPSQGTELCAIVEMMFSLENSLAVTGDVRFADRLEKVAYNTLPAACTPDYWRHQYVEQANQIASAYAQDPVYATVSGIANIFGLQPQYGCCTANMHQGWPKLASHLWMEIPEGGLAAVVYAPCVVDTQVQGDQVHIEEVTDYPFSESLTFNITTARPATFPLSFRVPEWTQGATLKLPDGTLESLKPGEFHQVLRQWSGTQTLLLQLPMSFKLKKGYQDSVSVERGPLIFSLGLQAKWFNFMPFKFQPAGAKKFDQAALPQSAWNYALALNLSDLNQSLTMTQRPLKGNPFEPGNEPIQVSVEGRKLDNWQSSQGAAEPPPQSPVESVEVLEKLMLSPYGSTRLRITAFPILK